MEDKMPEITAPTYYEIHKEKIRQKYIEKTKDTPKLTRGRKDGYRKYESIEDYEKQVELNRQRAKAYYQKNKEQVLQKRKTRSKSN
jgi:hypothetical protein